jgi:hypothetical protein
MAPAALLNGVQTQLPLDPSEDKYNTGNVNIYLKFMRVRLTIVDDEIQYALHILNFCL